MENLQVTGLDKTLFSYIPRKIEKENKLKPKDEIGVEILGVC